MEIVEDGGEDISGSLVLKIDSITGDSKVKTGKKSYWFVLDDAENRLKYYKSSKDVGAKEPIQSLELHGAIVSFGNSEENEFILSCNALEYQFHADSHKTMMKWVHVLQKQVKLKSSVVSMTAPPSKSLTLQTVPEEEALEIKTAPPEPMQRRKTGFRSFLQRLFGKKSRPATSTQSIVVVNNEVKAAPLRSVVGSMQDISTSKSGSASCKSCANLAKRNEYLDEQIRQLNEDIENINEEQRAMIRQAEQKDHEIVNLKFQYVSFLQKSLVKEDENQAAFKGISSFKQILLMMKNEEELRQLYSSEDGTMSQFVDYYGFVHGVRESPWQYLLNLTQQMKNKFQKKLQDYDDMYTKWVTYASSLTQDKYIIHDNTLKVLVQYGIPKHLREKVWKVLILNRVKDIITSKGENYYTKLVEQLPSFEEEREEDDGSIEKQIKIDLLRTMPTHQEFQNLYEDKIPVLHRVLRAYLLHNPTIGYSQGMNFMVAFALLVVDEETSFWLLVAITEVFFSEQHYNMYLSGTQANQKVLEHVCKQEFPRLMDHLSSLTCEISPVSFNWFMTIFFDSLPIDLVMQIWDCFLVYGHEILYRFGYALLKLHKRDLMKCKDPLSIMRKLKKMGKCFYDIEELLYEVFNSEFRYSEEELLELYNQYLMEINEENFRRKKEDEEYEREQQKKKFTPRAMVVSVSDNLDQLDDDLIIKCAECEDNRNFVWLCCTSDLMGQLFILNVASRTSNPVNWKVDCKCLDMTYLPTARAMLVSTIKSAVYAIDTETKKELWKLQLSGSVLSISCDVTGNVILSLMDGSIAILCIEGKELRQTYPTYVDLSMSPVLCGCLVDHYYWCGAANNIHVVDITTLETETSMLVCPKPRHAITSLTPSEWGVWATVKNSAVLHLLDSEKFVCLLTVDVLESCGLLSEKKSKSLPGTTVTALMCLKDKLWVGFGNGRFIISDVTRTQNNDDDLNDAIKMFKSESSENLKQRRKSGSPFKMTRSHKMSVSVCYHDIVGEEESEDDARLSVISNGETNISLANKRDKNGNNEVSIKMNQIQRVSEQPVDCFLPCRNDGKIVLTCMGAINDDSSVILWSSEKRDGREMWFAQTVSYNE